MKNLPLIFLVAAYSPSSRGAVIFTNVPDPGPGRFSDLPAMIDLDGNGTLDLGVRPRTVGGSLVSFEATVSLTSAVLILRPLDSRQRQFIVGHNFRIDSLEGRPRYEYLEHWKEIPTDPASFRLALFSGFSDTGEGDFYEKTGYLGFRFEGDEGTHYGYAHIDGRQAYNYRILSYAYESEPNTPILTGAIPEPSTSFLLMLLPTLVWRRKRRSRGSSR